MEFFKKFALNLLNFNSKNATELFSILNYNFKNYLSNLSQSISASTILGPYFIREANKSDSNKMKLKFIENEPNQQSLIREFIPIDVESFKLNHITWTNSKSKANCLAISNGQKLFIIVLKTVQNWFELNAKIILSNSNNIQLGSSNKKNDSAPSSETKNIKKKFICSRCSISFTNTEKLNFHQNFYCKLLEKSDFNKIINEEASSSLTFKEKILPQTFDLINETQSTVNFTPIMNKFQSLDFISQSLLLAVIESNNQQQFINNTKKLKNDEKRKNLENNPTLNSIVNNNLLQNEFNLSNTNCIIDESTQNINAPILLPVAYHSNNENSLVQIIGSAQTIIPVAIHQSMPINLLPLRPLLINNEQAQNLCISKNLSIPINNSQNTSTNFHLQIALTNQQPIFPIQTNNSITSNNNVTNNNNKTMSTFDEIFFQLKSNFNKDSTNNSNVISKTNFDCSSTPCTSFLINDETLNDLSNQINLSISEEKTLKNLYKDNLKNENLNKSNSVNESPPFDLSIIKLDQQNIENQNKKFKQLNANDIKIVLLNNTELRKRKQDDNESLSDQTKFDNNDNQKSNKTINHLLIKRQRLMCECGVSFSAEETLNGHKMYYCKNRILSDEEKVQTNSFHCQLCDYQPTTYSQLSQHIRTMHTKIQSYVCTLCGYKGYSQRGIKSHLRVTHDREFQQCKLASQTDLNLADFVFHVTSNSDTKENLCCIKCLQNFSTNELFYRHECFNKFQEIKKQSVMI